MFEKLAWTGLITAVTAASTAIGFRIADRVWRETMRTAPPTIPKWARRVVGSPVKKRVFTSLLDPALPVQREMSAR